MRRIANLLIPAALAAACGCSSLGQNPVASTGWRFEVGSPSTLTLPTTAVVQQSAGPVAAMPLTAAVAVGKGGPVLAASPCEAAPPAAGPRLAAGESCTLDDVCRKVDDIGRRVSVLETYKTMPKGPPQ